MRRLSAPRWPVGVVAAGLVALFAAGAAAQPGRRLGPNPGPAAGPGFPAAGGEDVTEYECLKCHHKFTARTPPERCPNCRVVIHEVTDQATGKTTKTEAGERASTGKVIGGVVALILFAGLLLFRVLNMRNRDSPPPRRRKPRPRPRPEPEDDEDDRPRRRSARARDGDEDNAPPPRSAKARTAPASDDPPRRAKPVKPADDGFEVVDDTGQFEVVDDAQPPRQPNR